MLFSAPTFKQILPHFVAVALFAAIPLLYFSPLLKGKQLKQGDIVNFQGMSKEIEEFRKKTGEEALWTNSMFGGMPAYQISVVYKKNLMRYVDRVFNLGLPLPANYVFLYFIGFYFLLVCMRVNPWLSIAGALAFGFSSYFFIILEAGHNSKAHAIAYMPPVVAGVILAYRGKYLVGGAVTMLFLALELYANHLQITYYLFLALFIYTLFVLYDALKSKTLPSFFKASMALAIAGVFAVGSNISNIWATYEYGKYTTRGPSELTINPDGTTNEGDKTTGLDKSYATAWSYGVSETFTLLIPDFFGRSSQAELGTSSNVFNALKENNVPNAQNIVKQLPLYWGDQPFTSGAVYVGAAVCFLFVLGLLVVEGYLKWWLLAATILSIVLAWGRNFMIFNELMLDYFPAYNKFRAVSMTLVLAEFTMPFLAVLTVKSILEKITSDKNELIKKLKIAVSITGGTCLLFALLGYSLFDFNAASDPELASSGWPDFLIAALRDDRASMLRTSAFRSLFFIAAAAALIWLAIVEKIKTTWLYASLALLFLADLWSVDRNYLNNESFVSKSKVEVPHQPTPADQQILADKDPSYRVFNTTARLDQDSRTSYFHKNIGGYHGAKLKRYQEMIDFHLSRGVNMSVLNMLNAKYAIVKGENGEPVVQRNSTALGNAWFVGEYKLVANADSEITAMTNFDPAMTAIVDRRFSEYVTGLSLKKDSLANMKLTEYKPNRLYYESNTIAEQLAVFSEIYYDKGWNAYIDGIKTPHIRVNYVLRALRIPAGQHKIEFKFEPSAYATGEAISLASSSLLLLLVAYAVAIGLKKVRKNS